MPDINRTAKEKTRTAKGGGEIAELLRRASLDSGDRISCDSKEFFTPHSQDNQQPQASSAHEHKIQAYVLENTD